MAALWLGWPAAAIRLDNAEMLALRATALIAASRLWDVARRMPLRIEPPKHLPLVSGQRATDVLAIGLRPGDAWSTPAVRRLALRPRSEPPEPFAVHGSRAAVEWRAERVIISAERAVDARKSLEALRIGKSRPSGRSRLSLRVKRAMDMTVAAGLLLALVPVLLALAAAIKLTSRGPILFRSERIGRQGASFDMLKFRTMYDGADDDRAVLLQRNEIKGIIKIAHDPRLTRIGHILRRYSFDELPQLVNVLRGQMSLIGPRPLVRDEDALIKGWQRRRHEATPGMTGLWQIMGKTRAPLAEMVRLDYLYHSDWSLWLDVKILLRTVPYVLGGRGL
jgi:lipopolysaccharide/colanic/teichoic acid biosynthesis glycosyltransferase